MRHFLGSFLRDEEGQDFIEYTLLLTFVVLASAALLIGTTDSVSNIWGLTDNSLSAARAKAAS
jgi:Flp pilus assembly pilin Flp